MFQLGWKLSGRFNVKFINGQGGLKQLNMNKVPTDHQLGKLPRIPLRPQPCGAEDFIYLFPYDPSTSDYFLEYTFNEFRVEQTKFIMGSDTHEPAISGKHSSYVALIPKWITL